MDRAVNTSLTIIEAGHPSGRTELRELRQSFGLLYFLIWRDAKVRYRQTALGVVWALLQPLALAAVFAVFLGRLAKVPSDGIQYGLFVLAGLSVWGLFANGVDAATNSLVGNVNLVTKVYFPRIILPLASIGVFVIDLGLSAALVLLYEGLVGDGLELAALLLPAILAWAAWVTASVGVLLGALNVRYRDVRHALRFLTQLWLFLSPVAYSWTLVPSRWRTVYGINPMAGVVASFRWAAVGGPAPPAGLLAASIGSTAAICVLGVMVFRRAQLSFSDVI